MKKTKDAITNQNQRLVALIYRDDHRHIYKKFFDKLIK